MPDAPNPLAALDQDMVFVPKGWGSELWVANDPDRNYCGKILTFYPGKKFSYHCHKEKHETFYVLTGAFTVYFGYDPDVTAARAASLFPGNRFTVPPGLYHRLETTTGGTVAEFSTFHRDEDSYRSEKGD